MIKINTSASENIDGVSIQCKKISERTIKLSINAAYNGVYGLGEKFDKINHKGSRCINQVEEKFCNQGEKTYCSIPFFFTDVGFGVFVDTNERTVFDFNEEIFLEVPVNADVYYFSGKPKDIVREFNSMLGEIKAPPKYAFGPWISANRWNKQLDVDNVINELKDNKIPATVLVLEAWSDEATFYIFNGADYKEKDGDESFTYDDFDFSKSRYWQDPKGMIEKLKDMGIATVLWQIPAYKKVGAGEYNKQSENDEKYAVENGLCLMRRDGNPYRIPDGNWFSGALVPDFTNPRAREIWMSKRKYLLDIGVAGFKTDGGEFIYGEDVVSADGSDGNGLKNAYCQRYVDAYHEYLGDENVLFSRAGYIGAQKTPILWAGDHQSTFEELRNVYKAGISAACSGIIFWGFDIGGFAGPLPSLELYLRSTQLAVFCPIMQWHSEPDGGQFKELLASAGGNNERSPWNMARVYDAPEYIEEIRKWHELRMKLMPYIYSQADKSAQNGIPIMRPLFFDHPEDKRAYDYEDEYLFGDYMLIAPILYEGEKSRAVYLPSGTWIGLFSEKKYKGDSVIKSIEEYPVYIMESHKNDIF